MNECPGVSPAASGNGVLTEVIRKEAIIPDISPWGTPVIPWEKRNEIMRLCTIYREINKTTNKNK